MNKYKYKYDLEYMDIVNDILSGKDKAVENYIEFLKCGRKKNPIDTLKIAGVDLTKKETITEALNMFDDVIDEFKKLSEIK